MKHAAVPKLGGHDELDPPRDLGWRHGGPVSSVVLAPLLFAFGATWLNVVGCSSPTFATSWCLRL
jgi:hypothetical protein